MTRIIYCIVEIDDDDGVYDGVIDELIIDDLFPSDSLSTGIRIYAFEPIDSYTSG